MRCKPVLLRPTMIVSMSVLAILGTLCVSTAQAGMLWSLGFESEAGVTVTDGQAVASDYAMDGTTDLPSPADPNARSVPPTTVNASTLTYAEYGISVGAIPQEINPNNVAGNFCLNAFGESSTTPSPADWIVDTKTSVNGICSNTGNADNFLTMEGYFNLQEDLVTNVASENFDTLNRTIFCQRRGSWNQGRIWLGLGVPSGENATPVLAIRYADGTAANFLNVLGSTEILQDEWNHIAMTLDTHNVDIEGEMVTQSDLRVYLNGILEFSVLDADLYPTASSSRSFNLGDCNPTLNESFVGYVDAIRIADRALAPSQLYCSVPEPSTFVMFIMGIVGLMFVRRWSC